MTNKIVSEKMLKSAVSEAVKVGLIPKSGFPDMVAENWIRIEKVIEAAIKAEKD